VLCGDAGELLNESAAAGAFPGQLNLIRCDVVDGYVDNIRAQVESCYRQRQYGNTAVGGDVFEFLLNGMEDRLTSRRSPA
jgi:hypothetical protein